MCPRPYDTIAAPPMSWLQDDTVRTLLSLLESNGFQAFVVGGAVRDALLGRPIGDIDIATNAHPETVLTLARGQGLKTIPTGLSHGTVTVVIAGRGFEVTTFRQDILSDGRHAQVVFAQDIATDAARRDFTMNALYLDAAGVLHDPLGTGHADLHAKQVRFIGDAAARIREDYLRILRFFRFYAHYGDSSQGIDADGLAACGAHLEGLSRLSAERIGAEMMRLFAAPAPLPALYAMFHTGVLPFILPGSYLNTLEVFEHIAPSFNLAPPKPVHRLACLCPAARLDDRLLHTDFAARLCLSKAHKKQLITLTRAAQGVVSGQIKAKELGYRLGVVDGRAALILAKALLGQPVPQHEAGALESDITQGAGASFPLRAADFPHLSGAPLGQALRQAERDWIEHDFNLHPSPKTPDTE